MPDYKDECHDINLLLVGMGVKSKIRIHKEDGDWYMEFTYKNGGTFSTGLGDTDGEVLASLDAIDFVLTWISRWERRDDSCAN